MPPRQLPMTSKINERLINKLRERAGKADKQDR